MSITLHSLRDGVRYAASARKRGTFRSSDPAYTAVQGGWSDGARTFMAIIRPSADGFERARLLELAPDGTVLRESAPLPLDHANNLSYHPGWDALLVTHCQSPDGHFNRLSLVNPADFSIRRTIDLPHPFFALAYCAALDRFASGEWAGETLDVWDGALRPLLHVGVEKPRTLSQGMCCDAAGLCFVRSSQNGCGPELRLYDWQCALRRVIPLALEDGVEPESVNITADGRTLVAGTDWRSGEGALFELEFSEVNE